MATWPQVSVSHGVSEETTYRLRDAVSCDLVKCDADGGAVCLSSIAYSAVYRVQY